MSQWEVGLAAAILLMAAGEMLALAEARRGGLTRNVSRLVSHGIIVVGSLLIAIWNPIWSAKMASALPADQPELNWPFLVVGVMIGAIVSYELIALMRAKAQGLTGNVSRLVSHLAMLVLLFVLMSLNVTKWELYLG